MLRLLSVILQTNKTSRYFTHKNQVAYSQPASSNTQTLDKNRIITAKKGINDCVIQNFYSLSKETGSAEDETASRWPSGT